MLVTIARYSFPYEAQIAKSQLDASGIPAFIADEHTINMQWLYSDAMGGVRLQVLQEHVADAQSILSDSAPINPEIEKAPPQPVCSICGGMLSAPFQTGRRPTILSWLLLGLPLWPIKNQRKCTKCGVVSKI